MWLVRLAMRRPITIMVIVCAIVILSILAILHMKVDIFPTLDVPRISVVQPYGGMDPVQLEGYIVTFYEQHFFYISGVDHISSRSIQSAAVIDIYFQPGTNMADAMAQVNAQVQRSRSYMPPGTVTPFILRFDVGNVPVGFLVFASPNRSLGEIQDLVYTRVRPVVSTIPGASTPPPFGGNQRSIVITVNSSKLNQYHLSIDDIVKAINSGNLLTPSGIIRSGDIQRMTTINSIVLNIQEMGNIPLNLGPGAAVYLRDIATISDSTDITTGYALVNSRRAVFMAISKRASSSTLSVVDGIKEKLDYMQSLLPPDIKVKFEFDQSIYVIEALRGLLFEAAIGALLTGAAVLLFLQDIRSSLIVVLNIPFAVLASLVGLWVAGQSINIMTLSGLALAIGILVDEATVTIENIHSHLARQANAYKAIYDASYEVVIPRLLAMLSVVSVFLPSFFMVGTTRSLFVPLSLAVGLAMFASYLLSGSFVPIMSAWLLKSHFDPKQLQTNNKTNKRKNLFERLQKQFKRLLIRANNRRLLTVGIMIFVGLSALFIYPFMGQELFPTGNPNGFQLRIKAPTGTRFEKTEEITKEVLQMIAQDVGQNNIEMTIGYVGTHPPTYAISNLYMWTSGPQEALLLVSFKEVGIQIQTLQEKLRRQFKKSFPEVNFTFEAGDIVNKVMSLGSATPIQVDIDGPNYASDQEYAQKLLSTLKQIDYLHDVGIVQPLNYPTIAVTIDRIRAGQLNVTLKDISSALIASTYSSRFITPIYWADPNNGIAYQVQVEIPQAQMHSLENIGNLPIKTEGFSGPFLRDAGQVNLSSMPGEIDHYNMRRLISITANIAGNDLGKAAKIVKSTINKLGKPPRGVSVTLRGQIPIMNDTFIALSLGVVFAVVTIFLLLVAFFQSIRLSLIIISITPTIVFGAILLLFLTNTTLNIQSFMGTIMATGIGVANAILVVVFAEECRKSGVSAKTAAITGATARLRPVLMTSMAMIVGMIPMALGWGEGGERTAALGRAVIGGLFASTTAVLIVLPVIYAFVQNKASKKGVSLLPE